MSIVEDASNMLVGRKIVEVRPMTQEELDASMWHRGGLVLVLDDGITLWPSQDDEGNGPGAFRGDTPEGNGIMIPTL
jgi:hypothetical protein